jgi:hypothetical protein
MTLHIRRVVTGHDADGKAVIVADGEAPRSWRRPSGLGHSLFWVTDAMPVDNAGHADGGDQDIGIPPPPHGSVFRIVECPPQGTAFIPDVILVRIASWPGNLVRGAQLRRQEVQPCPG